MADLPGLIGFVVRLGTVLALPCAAMVAVGFAIVFAAKRRPRRALSALLAIVIPVLLWTPMVWTIDYAHLALTARFGAGQIGSPTKSDQGQFTTHDWSVGFAGGPRPNYDQCIGYKIPLFLGGVDDLANLEVSDFNVNWTISAQLLAKVRGLPEGAVISRVSISD